ncbi:hypothetical protein PPERSA_10906 [Pseudocohnilembus persalinus]|uniref:Uncharacterized protein n=1 Tax=Pseudocohnilembus persalinus TaxID=266149 RepID=A0A0V0R9H9_PSEPJ|nr:hypothetical protein PPERSA_10906 [Pseudocohnilembus persalinus]|eukprot:KRX11139.1 hypothetical protein PPERSA_10906 [Pseudocohnilembus persalinus]
MDNGLGFSLSQKKQLRQENDLKKFKYQLNEKKLTYSKLGKFNQQTQNLQQELREIFQTGPAPIEGDLLSQIIAKGQETENPKQYLQNIIDKMNSNIDIKNYINYVPMLDREECDTIIEKIYLNRNSNLLHKQSEDFQIRYFNQEESLNAR